MKKKLLVVLGVVVAVLVFAFIGITNGLSEGAAVTLDGVNLSSVPDGDYTGTYDFKRWTNTVIVHVKDHRITGIEIQDDVGAAGITNCSAEIFSRVVNIQDTKVDAVSGATVTSKAYLKAIENALNR